MDMLGGADVIIFIMFLVPLGLGALGVAVMFAARPRRHAHPACRGCGYDLTASADSATKCSECGAAFAEVGIRPIREPSRFVPWMIGLLLVFGCVAAFIIVPLLLIGF